MLLVDLIPTVVASAAAVLDLKYRRIPNWLTLGALCIGLGVQFSRSGASGIPVALAGAALGLVVLLPFYVMRAIGAGDVKLLAALGALLGPQTLVTVIIYTAIVGGAISLIVMVREGRLQLFLGSLLSNPLGIRRSGATAPYGVAIASGVYLSMLLPSVIG